MSGAVAQKRSSARSLRNEIARNLLDGAIGLRVEPTFSDMRDRLDDAATAIDAVLSYGLAFGWDEVIDEVCKP